MSNKIFVGESINTISLMNGKLSKLNNQVRVPKVGTVSINTDAFKLIGSGFTLSKLSLDDENTIDKKVSRGR